MPLPTHILSSCERFGCMSHEDKLNVLYKSKLCFNCLKPNHRASDCRAETHCNEPGCHGRHHTLLHRRQTGKMTPSKVSINSTHSNIPTTYMGVLPVRLIGPLGSVDAYAVLDNGSDSTLLSVGIADRIGVKEKSTQLEVTTIVGTALRETAVVRFDIQSVNDGYCFTIENAYTVDALPLRDACVPSENLMKRWPHLQDVELHRLKCNTVSLLIGASVPEAHWVLDQRIGSSKQPFATLTVLGWVLFGPAGGRERGTTVVNFLETQDSLESDILRLYETDFNEQRNSTENEPSIEDEQVLKLTKQTTNLVDGHYQVQLPWKLDWHKLIGSRSIAEKRLFYLRSRLLRDEILLSRYTEIISAHERKGYISKLSDGQQEPRSFVPHHPVINPHKPGKVRIVFDCAAKYQGLSLNDCLYSGVQFDKRSNRCVTAFPTPRNCTGR